MEEKCSQCYSYAINLGIDGRDRITDTNLCDVCYWRKRAETAEARVAELEEELTAERRRLDWLLVGVRSELSNRRTLVLIPRAPTGKMYGAIDWDQDPGEWAADSFREAIDAALAAKEE